MGKKKKRCGAAVCTRGLATHVALSDLFCVYLCDRCAVERRPKGNWSLQRLTAPGADTYLTTPPAVTGAGE